MQPYFEGELAGRSGKPFLANPHRQDSNEHACWEIGWDHGRYDAAVRDSDEDEQEISCPECTAEGKQIRLRDGSFLWDPDGYICSDSDPNGVTPVDDKTELLFCNSCHTPFYHRNQDHDAYYTSDVEDYHCSRPPVVTATHTSSAVVIGYVYVVRSNSRIRIGKAKSRARYLSYKVGLPNGCEVLRVWSVAYPKLWEDHLHARYAKFKIHGSWYEIPEDILRELLLLEPPRAS